MDDTDRRCSNEFEDKLSDACSSGEDDLRVAVVEQDNTNLSTVVAVDHSCSRVDPELHCQPTPGRHTPVQTIWDGQRYASLGDSAPSGGNPNVTAAKKIIASSTSAAPHRRLGTFTQDLDLQLRRHANHCQE